MGNLIDLVGKQFGKWTVLARALPRSLPVYWLCKCACGTVKKVQGGSLKNGTNTCCMQCAKTTHGQAYSSTYRCWINMKQRCTNPKHPQYADYGGRGILFDDAWADFSVFLAEMGSRTGKLSLERVDNNKGYCKANCVWATRKAQGRNTRTTKLSTEIAARIRASNAGSSELAKLYGVTTANIWLVRSGKTWR